MIKCRNYREIFPLTPAEICKIMSHIEMDENKCWIWMGELKERDYGKVGLRGSTWLVHRMIYELFVGPIPPGYVVDHRCRNPRCCNPEHLEAVPPRENARRAVPNRPPKRPPSTHCRRGHALIGDNLLVTHSGTRTLRLCRTCQRERGRRYKARQKQAKAATPAGSRRP